jgi:hypothetical protein
MLGGGLWLKQEKFINKKSYEKYPWIILMIVGNMVLVGAFPCTFDINSTLPNLH